MKKLFLLDAYALIYRAYYGFIKSPRINSKGENTSAVLGFVNTLEEILTKENPDYIGVAFDPHGPTFRHEAFPEYKFQICLSAITEDYLFVKNPDGGYYKIPITLDSCLKQVSITDNIGITQASGKTYLAFGDEYNLIYDISTPEKLEELGITIVSEI